jgi:serine/threonine protein kinase
LDKLLYDKGQYILNDQKMRWVREIAKGMCHLHKFNIVHRELAARNILLTQPNPTGKAKISVFHFH